jgi:hypothetical protein
MANTDGGGGGYCDERNEVLLRLSNACQQHQLHHTDEEHNNDHHDDGPLLSVQCQKDLQSLRKILPKVEETYQAANTPHPIQVAHLCDFYRNVMDGTFCPHAPSLFRTNSDSSTPWDATLASGGGKLRILVCLLSPPRHHQ